MFSTNPTSIITYHSENIKLFLGGIQVNDLAVKQQMPIEVVLPIDSNGKVSARETYKFLELSDGQFSRWAKSNITQNPFAVEHEDYEGFDMDVEGNEIKDYMLSIPFAKKICMLSKTPKGEEARNYFIKVEGMLKRVTLTNFKIPTTLPEALRLAASIQEEKEELEKEIEVLKPQAKGYKLIVDSEGLLSLNEFAKSMNWGRNRLSNLLRKHDIFMKGRALPYQQFITTGYFKVREKTACDGNVYSYSLVTPKGIDYIVKKVQEWGVADLLLKDYKKGVDCGMKDLLKFDTPHFLNPEEADIVAESLENIVRCAFYLGRDDETDLQSDVENELESTMEEYNAESKYEKAYYDLFDTVDGYNWFITENKMPDPLFKVVVDNEKMKYLKDKDYKIYKVVLA